MKFSTELHEKYVILQLQEERLTSTIAPQLKSEFILLNAEGKSNLLLDLSHVSFADSSGLSALLRANSLAQNSGGMFVIYGLRPHVEKLITISQLDRVLTILPTRQDAIEAAFMHDINAGSDDDLSGEIMNEFGDLTSEGPEAEKGA